jgi:hypothetical protein
MTLTPAQCRATRRFLKLSREELAAAVDFSPLRLAAFEAGLLTLSGPERATLRCVFELAAIVTPGRRRKALALEMDLPEDR